MNEPVDPFRPSAPADQLSLFGPGEGRMQPAVRSFAPDPETARHRLRTVLAMAREAKVMPWPERDARMWETVFPQMANWLPEEEADRLRLAFAREIERLKGGG